MKPFDLSQYMFNVSQAAGAGLMGFDAGQTYAAGTVGAALKAAAGGAYVLKAGDTMTGALAITNTNNDLLTLTTTTVRGSGQNGIRFRDPTGVKGNIGYAYSNDDMYFVNQIGGSKLYLGSSNVLQTFAVDGAALSCGVNTATPAFGMDVNRPSMAVGPKTALSGGGGFIQFRKDTGANSWILGHQGIGGAVDFRFYNNVTGNVPLVIGADDTIFVRRDGSTEIRMLNNNNRGWRMIQDSVTTTLGSFYIQGTTDGFASSFLNTMNINAVGDLTVAGSAFWLRGNQFLIQHDGTHCYVRGQIGSGNLYLGSNGANYVAVNASAMHPTTDGNRDCGYPSVRWGTVHAATGTINTSDGREKKWKGSLTAAEMAASKAIANSIGKYQWLSAIEEKGDEARQHIGVIAQTVIEIMAEHELDAFRYGFVCHDEWEETVHPGGEGADDIITPAGDRYSVRYDELSMFIAAAQQQKQDELEARIAALEGAGV